MRKLILFNLYAFLFWIAALSLSCFNLAFFRYIESFSALIIILVLVGINLTALIQLFNSKQFSKIEILSIASVLALIISPFLITLEYSFLSYLSPNLPFINSLAIFILLLIIRYKKMDANLENFDFISFKITRNDILKFIKSPLFFTLLIFISSIIITFSAFYALPELDPYHWYADYQEMLSQGKIAALSEYRPLFISLVYIFNQSSNIDLYAVFKYVIPLCALLILIPSYLVTTRFDSKLQKFLIFLFPFINASAFLYLEMPIPQAFFSIITYFFTLFLIYSWLSQNNFFYFLSGAIILSAYFYHESATLMFLIWCIIALIFFGKRIAETAKKNTLASFLILAIFILNFLPFIRGPFEFLSYNFKKIILHLSASNFNLFFPAHYTNIDGNLMGWGDFIGVIKYYAFYVGPTFFIIFLFFTYLLFRDFNFRNYAKKSLFSKEVLTLIISFLLFFSISEVIPRIFDISLLPERSWIFGGIFSIVFLFIIFKYQCQNKFLYILIIISLFINLGGALYINNLKKYIITSGDLNSAEWIKKNLPGDRILFSNSKRWAIKLYSSSMPIGVPDEFYYNLDIYQKTINKFKHGEIEFDTQYDDLTNEMIDNISDLKKYDFKKQRDNITSLLEKNSILSRKISNLQLPLNSEKNQGLYIYFSKTNENNPYINRPYYKVSNQLRDFIFDKYPEKFKRIYFDQVNDIIIWQIL